jgi:polysaccharide biosynthesis/export protein
MPQPPFRFFRAARILFFVGLALLPAIARAQVPTPEEIQAKLAAQPGLADQLRAKIQASGLTDDQIRARLRAAGYPDNLLDQYLPGADTTNVLTPAGNILVAAQTLGIVGAAQAESLLVLTDSARHVADSLRKDSLNITSNGLRVFGLDLFQRSNTLFDATLGGPVDPKYRLGPGDELVLILTGDVEQAYDLTISREGFLTIPQVGQLSVANLTMRELEDLLYARLARAYSGIRRGPNATTKFTVTVAKLRTIQVYVVGDVSWPGSYQVSAAGTALTALYAAGGPTSRGSFRRVEIRRKGALVDSLDIYDYLLRGDASHDTRLENGDVVFVPVRQTLVKAAGQIVRPAIYELKPGETLRDLIHSAGGFDAEALRTRVQINRIVPPEERQGTGRDRMVIDLASEQFVDGEGPAFPMQNGDSVMVFSVADRLRNFVTVLGAVWVPGPVGFTSGMKLSDALHLAGGPKPDFYTGQVLVSRLLTDSTRVQLRSSFRDTTGTLTDDLPLMEDDEIQVFGRTEFRPDRFIAITGAVRRPGQLPYREGMTLRDAVLQASGLREDALLTEAEVARLPPEEIRVNGALATTMRVPLDSTYLFERTPDGRYLGPPGVQAPAAGSPETVLQPYDNVLILHQPDWELQRTVMLMGAVRYPGRYSLQTRTDRITDVLRRAGGLTREAYPEGIVFTRSVDRGGRIGVDLPHVLKDSTNHDNLILVGGDSLFIPEYNPVVYVRGAVNAPISVSYAAGQNMDFYIGAAGGFSFKADRGRSYVTQPSGKVESVKRHFLFADGKPTPAAGAVVFVPDKEVKPPRDTASTLGALAAILASLTTVVVVLTR